MLRILPHVLGGYLQSVSQPLTHFSSCAKGLLRLGDMGTELLFRQGRQREFVDISHQFVFSRWSAAAGVWTHTPFEDLRRRRSGFGWRWKMPLSWVEIDLEALRHNFSCVKDRMGPHTHIVGVVKSDAYGHGMVPVARELVSCGAHFLAVSKYWEARELRDSGIEAPILVLLGLECEDMEEAILNDIRPALFRLDHARLLSDAACRLNAQVRVHLKVDTGMGRLGVPCAEVAGFLEEFMTLPGLLLEGILSHFASSDEADKTFCQCQLDRFREVLQMLYREGHPITYAHIANSAGLLDLPGAHFQLVRPGIMLYGSLPSQELVHPADLWPVMSFRSRILQLKSVPAGQSIGYGRTFVSQRGALIATIPVGYDDGYPRLLSNRGHVLVRGVRAPLVGRVSMNMITVDVTDVPGVKEDDEVVLLGRQGNERITGEEIAELCHTISYEIFCNLGRHRFKTFLNPSGFPKGDVMGLHL